jgi:hypothetical protein
MSLWPFSSPLSGCGKARSGRSMYSWTIFWDSLKGRNNGGGTSPEFYCIQSMRCCSRPTPPAPFSKSQRQSKSCGKATAIGPPKRPCWDGMSTPHNVRSPFRATVPNGYAKSSHSSPQNAGSPPKHGTVPWENSAAWRWPFLAPVDYSPPSRQPFNRGKPSIAFASLGPSANNSQTLLLWPTTSTTVLPESKKSWPTNHPVLERWTPAATVWAVYGSFQVTAHWYGVVASTPQSRLTSSPQHTHAVP